VAVSALYAPSVTQAIGVALAALRAPVAAIPALERRKLRITVRTDEPQVVQDPITGIAIDMIENKWNWTSHPFAAATD